MRPSSQCRSRVLGARRCSLCSLWLTDFALDDRAASAQVDRLSAWYGRAQILFDVSLEVARGEVVALMGRNGAGKSTTLKAIMGLVERTGGTVSFRGQSLRGLQPFEIARAGAGLRARRTGASSPSSRCWRTSRWAGSRRATACPAWSPEKLFRLFPNLGEMRAAAGRTDERRRAADADRRPHAHGQPRTWCCWTSPRRGSRPKIVEDMANMILELKQRGPGGGAVRAEPALCASW